MKKLLTTLLFVFVTAGFAFAASSIEDLKKDMGVYNTDINPQIVDALSKIEQEMVEIDNILEGKSKKNIQTSLKIVENQVKSIEKHMKEKASKIKTPEVKRYHDVTLAYIQARYVFLKDVVDTYNQQHNPHIQTILANCAEIRTLKKLANVVLQTLSSR